jgi:zinc transport system substrate-binding protein
MRLAPLFSLVPGLLAAISGCSPAPKPRHPDNAGASPVRAFVTIVPQVDFVRRIGQDRVRVDLLVGPGQSEHTYEPTPRQMTDLAQARVYFSIGVPCEKSLLPRIADVNPGLMIVDTSADVPFRKGRTCCAAHPHDAEHDEHDDESVRDPHIWLDPRLVKIQARHIRDALGRIDPGGMDSYQRNCAEFEAQLDKLHTELSAQLAPYKGDEFIVFHPAYGYFADAYSLRQIAVEEEGKEPSVKQLAGLIDLAARKGIKVIFVQPQFATAGAATIATAVHGRTMQLDAMTVDYLRDIRVIAERLVSDFRSRTAPGQISAAVSH